MSTIFVLVDDTAKFAPAAVALENVPKQTEPVVSALLKISEPLDHVDFTFVTGIFPPCFLLLSAWFAE
jgi:hypothetical protein